MLGIVIKDRVRIKVKIGRVKMFVVYSVDYTP